MRERKARRHVPGGKKVKTWSYRHEGAEASVDVYMVENGRLDAERRTTFRAINEDLQIDVSGKDLDALAREVGEAAIAAMTVPWEKLLLITISGDAPPRGMKPAPKRKPGNLHSEETDRWDAEREKIPFQYSRPDPDPIKELTRLIGHEHRYSLYLKFEVQPIERAPDGRWRDQEGPGSRRNVNTSGLDLGYKAPEGSRYAYHSHDLGSMTALISDTRENRAAVLAIRERWHGLVEAMYAMFDPDRIAATLARALAGGGPIMLSSGDAPPKPSVDFKFSEPGAPPTSGSGVKGIRSRRAARESEPR